MVSPTKQRALSRESSQTVSWCLARIYFRHRWTDHFGPWLLANGKSLLQISLLNSRLWFHLLQCNLRFHLPLSVCFCITWRLWWQPCLEAGHLSVLRWISKRRICWNKQYTTEYKNITEVYKLNIIINDMKFK